MKLALERRADQLATMIGGTEFDADAVFNSAFNAQVSRAQLLAIFAQLRQFGRVNGVTKGDAVAGSSAVKFQLATDKGYVIPMTLSVESAAPNLVNGLFFAAPVRASGSLDDLLREIRALPGHTSLFAARVEDGKMVTIAAVDSERALAIGSAFKLYIFAELVRQIESGERRWTDVVALDSGSRSLPSGVLQTWPIGTPMTLQSLATVMISQSDNTAADQLLHLLGRENVERLQRIAGGVHAEMNEPFLTTRELFVLKSPEAAAFLERYVAGGAPERRAVLADSAFVHLQPQPDFGNGPNTIDTVEWFASTTDLARVMLWLRDHSAGAPTAAARDVLSVNKGIGWPSAAWRYVAFKGGSEPGVINLTFLAQRADGNWIVLVATWNDTEKLVNDATWIELATRVRDLIANN